MFNFKFATRKAKASGQQKHTQNQQASKATWKGGLLVFVLVAIISFVYHIPSSWVIQQASQNSLIPNHIQLNQAQGTIWNGKAQLSLTENNQTVELGQLHWRLSGLSLLSLHLDADVNLQTKSGGARGHLITGLFNQEQFEFSRLQGQMPVQDLQPLLPEAYRNLGELTGQVLLNDLGFVWDTSSNWLTEISGSVQFSKLNVMGVTFPKLALTPTLQDNNMRLEALGSGAGWNLTGQALLNLKNYQADFKVEAETPENMPDWTELIMRKNSAILATFKKKGRF